MEKEIEGLKTKKKEANRFIIDIAELLGMDVDGVGFDEIQFSIDDFKNAIIDNQRKALILFAKWHDDNDNYGNNWMDIKVDEYLEEKNNNKNKK